ncbi:hypothetical protein, partial [Cupriavidus sp. OTU4895]
RPKTEPTCFTVRALITFEACRETKDLSVRRHQAPTLIGCLFVKEPCATGFAVCVFCCLVAAYFVAAKKREYVAFLASRQLVRRFIFSTDSLADYSPSPRNPRRCCVSACCCVRFVLRGGEY